MPAAKPPEGAPTVGLTAADFIADPDKAIAQLRAEIRKEIIGTNVIAALILYLVLSPKRDGGLGL